MHKKISPLQVFKTLNPRPCADNAHASVLTFEMTVIEPDDGEIPTRKLSWKQVYTTNIHGEMSTSY
jgi:hypothetical protein